MFERIMKLEDEVAEFQGRDMEEGEEEEVVTNKKQNATLQSTILNKCFISSVSFALQSLQLYLVLDTDGSIYGTTVLLDE